MSTTASPCKVHRDAMAACRAQLHRAIGPSDTFVALHSCDDCGADEVCSARFLCPTNAVFNPFNLVDGLCPACAEFRRLTKVHWDNDHTVAPAAGLALARVLRRATEGAATATACRSA